MSLEHEFLERLATNKFPVEARTDWEGTNHFEIQNLDHGAESFWWLDVREFDEGDAESRARFGLVLDLAVWAARELRSKK